MCLRENLRDPSGNLVGSTGVEWVVGLGVKWVMLITGIW